MTRAFPLLAFIAAQSFATPTAQAIEITVDAESVSLVLSAMESGTLNETTRQALTDLPTTQGVVDKLISLGRETNRDEYLDSLAQVAAGQTPESDSFRFAQVMEHRDKIAVSLQAAVDDPAGMASRIQRIIAPYLPTPIELKLRLVLVAGSNSCGWTTGSGDAFFVDLRCIRDDIDGMELLAGHEIYHVAQANFMHNESSELNETHSRVNMILRSLMSEGSAAYVADFMKLEEPGHYGRFNRREYEKNFQRMDQSETLFEALIQHAANDPDTDGNQIYRLGFTGYWDSPLYYVGYRIFEELERSIGREALLPLLTAPPEQLVLRYADLPTENRSLTLSDRTLQAIRNLDKARGQ